MPKPKLEVLRVFIASPGDLSEERKLFPKVIDRVNELKAKGLNYLLEPVGWEDALPGAGRPQEIINEDVKQCDIFLMLLWKRWGTPSSEEFTSGTEEEFNIAYKRYQETRSPHLLLYFRSVPQAMMADPGEQLRQVIKFRDKIEEGRLCLYKTYDEPPEWEDLLTTHLSRWLDRKASGAAFRDEPEREKITIPPEVEQRMLELQKELEEKNTQLQTTQSKLRSEAVNYAVEATKLVDEGKFTLAEQKFAKAIELYDEPYVLNTYGLFLTQIGSLDRAIEIFERMMEIVGEENQNMAAGFGNIGNIYLDRDELDKAKEMYEKALQIYIGINNLTGIGNGYCNLGIVYYKKGDLDKGEEMLNKALEIYTQLDDKELIANSSAHIGNIYIIRGELDKAEEMHKKSLQISIELGDKSGMADSYGAIGNIYRSRGNLDKAGEMYEKALHLHEAISYKLGMARVYINLGSLHRKKSEFDKAKEMWNISARLFKELGNDIAAQEAIDAINRLDTKTESP